MKKTALMVIATMGLASGFALAQDSQEMQVLTPAQSLEQPTSTEGNATEPSQNGATIHEERLKTQTTPSEEATASDEAGQDAQEDMSINKAE